MLELMKKPEMREYVCSASAEIPLKITPADDRRSKAEAGVQTHTYHGCPKCNKHVWDETDVGNACPVVGCSGRRRDENGVAFEEVIHFSLKARLEALVKSEAYSNALDYESWRRRPIDGVVSDVCDCEQWKSGMGDIERHDDSDPTTASGRIQLLFCQDGVPAHNYPVRLITLTLTLTLTLFSLHSSSTPGLRNPSTSGGCGAVATSMDTLQGGQHARRMFVSKGDARCATEEIFRQSH